MRFLSLVLVYSSCSSVCFGHINLMAVTYHVAMLTYQTLHYSIMGGPGDPSHRLIEKVNIKKNIFIMRKVKIGNETTFY